MTKIRYIVASIPILFQRIALFYIQFLCVPSQVTSSARQLDIVSTLKLLQILISGDNTQALINQYGKFLIALYVHVYVCLKKTVTLYHAS